MLGNYLSVNEAAEALGVTDGRIRQLLRAGVLTGVKANQRAWMVLKSSLRRAEREEDSVGRPRIGKNSA